MWLGSVGQVLTSGPGPPKLQTSNGPLSALYSLLCGLSQWLWPGPLTLQPWEEMIRRSAGTRSPPFTSTRSPTTTSSALICIFSPSRTTRACCGEAPGISGDAHLYPYLPLLLVSHLASNPTKEDRPCTLSNKIGPSVKSWRVFSAQASISEPKEAKG